MEQISPTGDVSKTYFDIPNIATEDRQTLTALLRAMRIDAAMQLLNRLTNR
jgi:outer membrane lipopolysaccharide assembly protein LptE/RlpB